MREFLATLPADLILGARVAEEAAVIAAEAAFLRAGREDEKLFDAFADPWKEPAFTAARDRTVTAGKRLAAAPVAGLLGLALKIHYMALDIAEGRTEWAEDLASRTRSDALHLLRLASATRPATGGGGRNSPSSTAADDGIIRPARGTLHTSEGTV